MARGQRALGREDVSLSPLVSRHDPHVLRRRGHCPSISAPAPMRRGNRSTIGSPGRRSTGSRTCWAPARWIPTRDWSSPMRSISKGNGWNHSTSPSTRPADFHLADGKSVSDADDVRSTSYGSAGYGAFNGDGTAFDTPREIPVDMPDNDPSLYPDARGFTALAAPVQGGQAVHGDHRPAIGRRPGRIGAEAAATGLQPWIDRIADRTVIVNVPKFKLETEYSLEKSLQALGMVRAFNEPGRPDGAQFDRMTTSDDPAQQLFISAVGHKTFVEVNEKGTEAAAATGRNDGRHRRRRVNDPRRGPSFRPFGPTNRFSSRSATPRPTAFSSSAVSSARKRPPSN